MWEWLKKLWQSAKNLVAKIFEAFLEWLLFLIEVAYMAYLTSLILTYFPYAYLLYFWIYVIDGVAAIKVWNPREAQGRSIVSKFEKVPSQFTQPNKEQEIVLQATRN
ncbi:hypothetical protein [Aerosakkonema funiforme]|uniref:hypothetical protein n=1 Tax=Aerosakkonema funiforme TaxID=1246630 RepID=UPI0035BB6310